MDQSPIGKSYPPVLYAIGREKIVEYAHATGETDPLHLDVDFARAAGHADVVAPPMFAVVYQGRAVAAPLFDPEVGIDFARLVHLGQELRWGEMAIAGDEVTSVVTVQDVSQRGGMGVYTFAADSVNQRGEPVASGIWTNLVRPT